MNHTPAGLFQLMAKPSWTSTTQDSLASKSATKILGLLHHGFTQSMHSRLWSLPLLRDLHTLTETSQVLPVSRPLLRRQERGKLNSASDIDYYAHFLLHPNTGSCLTRFLLKSCIHTRQAVLPYTVSILSLSAHVIDWLTVHCRFGVGLAVTLSELESEKHIVANDPEKLKVLFLEMTQMCLWCAHCPVNPVERPESISAGEMLLSVHLFSGGLSH